MPKKKPKKKPDKKKTDKKKSVRRKKAERRKKPIQREKSTRSKVPSGSSSAQMHQAVGPQTASQSDRKSTRLNSSHGYISYAVFCLKKKNKNRPSKQPSRMTCQ